MPGDDGTTVVRSFRATDRPRVREICCRAAFRGRGASAMLDDDELFADYWTRYYTDLEPESLLVAERDGAVVGYLLGCRDTSRFQHAMARTIVPSVGARLLARYVRGRYAGVAHRRALLRWLATRSWREAPRIDIRRFPAHYHVNVLPLGHGRRTYTALASRFVDDMLARGVERGHGQVTEPAERAPWNALARAFERHRPGWLEHYDERESTMERLLWGHPGRVLNSAYGFRLADLRECLAWAARRYGG